MSLMGVDIGTSGCRAVAFDGNLRALAGARGSYPTFCPGPGRAEQNAEFVWAAVEDCIRGVNAQVAGDPVTALAVAAQGEAVLALDAQGVPLGPVPLSFDYRAEAETEVLARTVGRDRLRTLTGQSPHPMLSVVKLAWWHEHEPELWDCAARLCCYGEFAAIRLGVEPAIDYTLAARTGALDLRSRAWSLEVLGALGLTADRLAVPVPCGQPLGHVSGWARAELGFGVPVILVAGAHDQAASLWGSGAVRPGQASFSLGTTDCLTALTRDAGLAGTPFPYYASDDGADRIALAGNPAGGAALKWFATEFGAERRRRIAVRGARRRARRGTRPSALCRKRDRRGRLRVDRRHRRADAADHSWNGGPRTGREFRIRVGRQPSPVRLCWRRDRRGPCHRRGRAQCARTADPCGCGGYAAGGLRRRGCHLPWRGPARGRRHRSVRVACGRASAAADSGRRTRGRFERRTRTPAGTLLTFVQSAPHRGPRSGRRGRHCFMSMAAITTAVRQSIVDYAQRAVRCGLVINTQGNISVRDPQSRSIAITPHDVEYDEMTAEDIVVVDYDGNVIDGSGEPSEETSVHRAVYAARPDLHAVVHTEPVFTNVFGALGKPIEPVLVSVLVANRGPSP